MPRLQSKEKHIAFQLSGKSNSVSSHKIALNRPFNSGLCIISIISQKPYLSPLTASEDSSIDLQSLRSP